MLASIAEPGTPVKRARPRTIRRVWHDSPDRALLSQELALSEQRGVWRIEALHQASLAVPAQPRDPVALGIPLPERLAAIAVLDGREWTAPVSVAQDTVTVTLLSGTVRGPVGDTPLSRVTLDGLAPAVRAAAERVAADHRIDLPLRGLAADAIALAGVLVESDPSPTAPSLDRAMAPVEAFRMILGSLLAGLLRDVPAVLDGSPDTEPVHRMRVAVRRMRSAVTVFRPVIACPALDQAQQGLKALAAGLGPTRDWDVFVTETLPMIMTAMPDNAALAALLTAAERRRRDVTAALRVYLDGPAFRVVTVGLAWLAGTQDWAPPAADAEQDLTHVARHVLRRRMKRLLAAGDAIETLDVPHLHDLRLHAKRTRYAAEMFADLYPGRHATRFIRRLSRLQQHLGVLNDGAVARALLEEVGALKGRHAHASGLVLGFAAHGMTTMRSPIADAWMKFRDTDPFWA